MIIKKCCGDDFKDVFYFCNLIEKRDVKFAGLDTANSNKIRALLNGNDIVLAAYDYDEQMIGLIISSIIAKSGTTKIYQSIGLIKGILVPIEFKQTTVAKTLITTCEQVLRSKFCSMNVLRVHEDDYFIRETVKSMGYRLSEESYYENFEKSLYNIDLDFNAIKALERGEKINIFTT